MDKDRWQIQWRLPDWIEEFLSKRKTHFPKVEARMEFAIALAEANVEAKTGGPFGAAIFDTQTGELIAPGMNLVTAQNQSCLHAEMVAVSLAQVRLGTFDLAKFGRFELVTSVEPCAMCLGSIPWSGVVSVVCGATCEDAESIGFDEGHKPADWVEGLRKRGISVTSQVLRDEAEEVLRAYQSSGAEIYNGSQVAAGE